MKIAFLVERPTQFEAPFYRFAARDPEHGFRVLFTGRDVAEPVFDPELGVPVAWGIDLLGGYPHEICPPDNADAWLAERCGVLVDAPARPGGHGLEPLADAPGTYVFET